MTAVDPESEPRLEIDLALNRSAHHRVEVSRWLIPRRPDRYREDSESPRSLGMAMVIAAHVMHSSRPLMGRGRSQD